MSDPNPKINLNMTADFRFEEVRPNHSVVAPPLPTAPLGPLAAFVGDWAGQGFNTIFRPNNSATPTPLPFPVPGSDNILELNLDRKSTRLNSSHSQNSYAV